MYYTMPKNYYNSKDGIMRKKLFCSFESETIKTKGSDGGQRTVIKGFANRSYKAGQKVVDRGNEHIPPEEWRVGEWQKNPIILFNHNRDMPIAKGIGVNVTEDGLWLEAEVSNSDAPEIKKIRDLIKEKILNSFSVGIDVQDEKMVDGALHLYGVDLLETSVVSIPMNQESQFELSTEDLKSMSMNDIRAKMLKVKGAAVAAEVHRKISEMQENEEFSRDDALVKIASDAGMSLNDLFEFLAGNVCTADEKLVHALASNLGIDSRTLTDLNQIDEQLGDREIKRPEDAQQEEKEGDEEEEGSEDDSQVLESEEDQVLEEEEAQGEDEELTDESETSLEGEDPMDDQLEDEEQIYLEEDEDEMQKSAADCVSRKIREAMQAGKPQDQAIAYAISECHSEKSCELKPESWGMVFKNLALPQPQITVPVEGQGYVESSPGDVGLQEAKQTNVLLAQLIGEIQGLKQIMGGAMLAAPQSIALAGHALSGEADREKNENLDIIGEYHGKLKARLDKLDV
jgi:HK97 family phage prohead protease